MKHYEKECFFCGSLNEFYKQHKYCKCRLDKIISRFMSRNADVSLIGITSNKKFERFARASFSGTRGVLSDKNRKKPNAVTSYKNNKRTVSKGFYDTREWRELRYDALKRYGKQCLLCGAQPPHVVLHVDHVRPRSKFPEGELSIDNLQILCADCNLGKSNRNSDDFREVKREESRENLTKREYFAIRCLQGLLTCDNGNTSSEDIEAATTLADDLIKELEKK